MRKLLTYFLQGILLTVPLSVTVYVLYLLVLQLNQLDNAITVYDIPYLGVFILLLSITIIGWIGTKIINRSFLYLIDNLLNKIPLIKVIYSSVKDLLSAFVGKDKKFNYPVLVKVNKVSNLEKLGFITQQDLSFINGEDNKIMVYFPHSYAFSGELFVVPSEDVKPIDKPSAEIMKFIISGGIIK